MTPKFLIQKSFTGLSLLVVGAVGSLLGQLLTSEALPQGALTQSALVEDSRLNLPEGVEQEQVSVGTLLAIAAVGGGAAGVILSARKTNNSLKPTAKYQNSTIAIDKASPQLQRKLLRLLHNDRATASRLLTQIKRNNPSQSINWAVEKAIYDLERDRH